VDGEVKEVKEEIERDIPSRTASIGSITRD
jgi:hypothetical protein